jgi:MerR family copper efflux transcriptional regulator
MAAYPLSTIAISRLFNGTLTLYRTTGLRLSSDSEGNGMEPLTIGHLAKEAGVNLETVRYYERRGLIPKPPRSLSGYRLYPAEAVRRLRFVQRAKELGFSLREIKELLSLRVSPGVNRAAIQLKTEAKIADIKTKIQCLESMEKTLRKLTKACGGCGPVSECPILESLDREDA